MTETRQRSAHKAAAELPHSKARDRRYGLTSACVRAPLKRVESWGARVHESLEIGARVAGFGVRKLCLRFVSKCCLE